MPARIKFEKLPGQKLFFEDTTTKTLLFSAGLGSGKTHALCMKALNLSYLNRGFPGGLLCPSFPDYKKDVFVEMVSILADNGIRYKYNQQDKTFQFPWTKAPLYVFTAEKPIAGPNLAYCLVNEYSLMKYDRIREMIRRVRIKKAPNKQRALAGTPEDVYGWLEDFVEAQEKRGDFRIVYADTNENIHIDDDYRKDLEAMLDEQSLRVFASGEIVRIGGNYFYYSYSPERVISDSVKYNSDLIIHVGMDFNVGYMTASLSHKIDLGSETKNEQHFFDEILLKGESNTYTMARALKNSEYPWDKMLISCDASGNNRSSSAREKVMSDVKILRAEGFEVRFKSQNPRLRQRQLLVNGMMYHGRIKANPKCTELLKDWKKTTQLPDYTKDSKTDKTRGHFSDGADYVLDFEHKLDIIRRKSRIIQL